MIINTVHISICTLEVQTEIYGVFAPYCYCTSNNRYHYYGKKYQLLLNKPFLLIQMYQ